ncbi:MAG: hypothetical protein H7X95_12135, partial [Deltaproteobacteria bacterium]|nr:hypothetical protein [Deltaproteobacteria bacterium]
MKATAIMNINTGLLALGILGGIAGCGETSYFEVAVVVDRNVTAVDQNCLFKIDSCEVSVMGAGGEKFFLKSGACHGPTGYNIGTFQYATDKDSGRV